MIRPSGGAVQRAPQTSQASLKLQKELGLKRGTCRLNGGAPPAGRPSTERDSRNEAQYEHHRDRAEHGRDERGRNRGRHAG